MIGPHLGTNMMLAPSQPELDFQVTSGMPLAKKRGSFRWLGGLRILFLDYILPFLAKICQRQYQWPPKFFLSHRVAGVAWLPALGPSCLLMELPMADELKSQKTYCQLNVLGQIGMDVSKHLLSLKK